MNLISLVPEYLCSSVYYGIRYNNELTDKRHVIIIDGGFTSCNITVIKYSKDCCEILYNVSDLKLGLRFINIILIDYLSLIIKQRYNKDPRCYDNVYYRMVNMVNKQRELLQKGGAKVPFIIPNIFQSNLSFSKSITYNEYIDLLIRNRINIKLSTLFGEAIKESKVNFSEQGFINIMFIGGLFKCSVYKEFIRLYIHETLHIPEIIEVKIDDKDYNNIISEGLCYYNNIQRNIVNYKVIDYSKSTTRNFKLNFDRDNVDTFSVPQYEIDKIKTEIQIYEEKIFDKLKEIHKLLYFIIIILEMNFSYY